MEDKRRWKERLREFVRTSKGRITKQRIQVAEVFFEMGGHPGVDLLTEEVQKRFPKIGQATIYRTMKLLCESGLAKPLEFGEGFSRFEAMGQHHDHLICLKCGKVIEFMVQEIEILQKVVAEQHGFSPTDHRLEIYGLCKDCLNK